MAISGIGSYGNVYGNLHALQNNVKEDSKICTESNEKYLDKLQEKAPYVRLEAGYGLKTKVKEKNGPGVVTIHPKLLEKMKNDPEAEKRCTQTIKDIERAEKTADAYYNALGGCVERTSTWYIDENGKFYHFAHTVRDDKLNKKLRLESQKNREKQIEKIRENTCKKAEELAEQLEEKAKEDVEIGQAAVGQGNMTGFSMDIMV